MYFNLLRKVLLFCTFTAGIALASGAYANDELKVEELKALQQKMQSATQLSLDFVQLKTTTLRPKKPSHSMGHASFAKPAKFRWELTKPVGETLIYDGTNLFSLNSKDKVATKYNATGERAVEIKEVIGVVLDFDSMLGKYTLTKASREGTTVVLELKPKKAGAIDGVEVRVDNASASIQGLKLIFANKNTTDFVFSNLDRKVLPTKTFAVPDDYKVTAGL